MSSIMNNRIFVTGALATVSLGSALAVNKLVGDRKHKHHKHHHHDKLVINRKLIDDINSGKINDEKLAKMITKKIVIDKDIQKDLDEGKIVLNQDILDKLAEQMQANAIKDINNQTPVQQVVQQPQQVASPISQAAPQVIYTPPVQQQYVQQPVVTQ